MGKRLKPGPIGGRPLDLADQYAFTSGGCASFARAAQPLLGGRIALLQALDHRQLDAHDHPRDVPLYVHVVVLTDDGDAIDAEGRRPEREMARAFGVKRGYAYRMVTDPAVLAEAFPTIRHELIARMSGIIVDHGWPAGVPEADGRLVRNWTQAIREHDARSGRPVTPTKAQARLYGLTPWYEEPNWSRFSSLEVRTHEEHGFVVVAIPSAPDEADEMLTSARSLVEAQDVACALSRISALDIDDRSPAHRIG